LFRAAAVVREIDGHRNSDTVFIEACDSGVGE
jgi:hypothetical protein